ncbi:MAG TPA: LysM peptidoglycan-binding domain-containing protein [Chthoniobacterales bacterium]
MNLKNLQNIIKRRGPQKKAQPSNRLKATARRVASPVEENYYEDDEPNVRLSRAFLVVMLLHVVAVGGIFLFSSFKKEETAGVPPKEEKTREITARPEPAADSREYVVGEDETLGSIASAFGVSRADLASINQLNPEVTVHAGDKLTIPAKTTVRTQDLDVKKLLSQPAKQEIAKTSVAMVKPAVAEIPKTQPNPEPVQKAVPLAPAATHTSDRIYVVQKGDNPVGIAKKLKVKYQDLISANKITDPRKLQIGQKLVVPE